jgi:archaellum component FlaC
MILLAMLILAALSTPQVYPGEELTVKVLYGAHLTLNDNCTYFAENGWQEIDASPGNYTVVVSPTCEPGIKTITVDRKGWVETLEFEVMEPTVEYLLNYSEKLREKNEQLTQKVAELSSEVNLLKKEIANYKNQIESLKEENERLVAEKKELQATIDQLNTKINELKSVIDEKNRIVASLQKQLNNLKGENYKLKVASLFIVSLFFGSYAAVIMRRKS